MTITPAGGAAASHGKPSRVEAIDVAKGLAILLVVFGHVWRGLNKAGIPIDPGVFLTVDTWIYSFHMPFFFFVSGLFIRRAAEKPAGRFINDRVATLLYPYALWLFFNGGLQIYSGGANTRMDWPTLFREMLYAPEKTQFWFLYVLMACSVLYLALRRCRLYDVTILCLSLLAIVFKYVHGFQIDGVEFGVVYQIAIYFPYFALGALTSPLVLRNLDGISRPRLFAGALVGIMIVTASIYSPLSYQENLPAEFFWFVPACAGTLMLLCVAAAAAGSRLASPLAFLGSISLQIYVTHVIAAAAVRMTLRRVLHVESLPIHLTAGLFAGLAFPLLLVALTERLGLRRLFVAPWYPRAARPVARAHSGTTYPSLARSA